MIGANPVPVSALPGRASLRQEDVWKRRYLVSGDGHLRTAWVGSRRSSRSIRSPPAGGAPRGDDNQRRGCTEVPIPFGGEEPKRYQDGPGRKALLVATCGLARGWHFSRRWPSRPLGVEMVRVGGTAPRFFLVILFGGIFGCGCSFGSSKAFEPTAQPVTGSLAHQGGFHDLPERWRILGACRAG